MGEAVGANVDELFDAARRFEHVTRRLTDVSSRLDAVTRNKVGTHWRGYDASRFGELWQTTHSRAFLNLIAELEDLGKRLSDQAREQERTSAGDGPTIPNGPIGIAPLIVDREIALPLGLDDSPERDVKAIGIRKPVPVDGFGSGVERERGVSKHRGNDSQSYDYTKTEVTDGTKRYASREGTTADQRTRDGSEYSYNEHAHADGSVSFVDGSAGWQRGYQSEALVGAGSLGALTFSGTASAYAGPKATAQGSVGYADGNVRAKGAVGASFGAGVDASGQANLGPVAMAGSASAFVGAEAAAEASVGIGKDGVVAEVGGSAFAGVRADVEASAELAGVKGTAGAGVSFGIGGHAEVEAKASINEVKLKVDVGAAIGLGVDIKFDIEVKPVETIKSVGKFFKSIF